MTGSLSSRARSLPELPPHSRYELLFKLASGGMASVYVGRLRGAGGFWRLVAIKKAHAHLMEDRSFRRMLVEEARLASRIHHPNVVPVLDVEQASDHLLLVMDYIEGASLSELLAAHPAEPLPPRLAIRIALDACAGLAAAHDLKDASGHPLQIVHRDVSPQNLLVGVDGLSRLTDFGIAKSAHRGSTTTTGALKGKLAYMAPEYVDGKTPDQRCDVFALGVVIWEALANRRLFRGDSEIETLKRVVEAQAPLLSTVAPWVNPELDPVLAAALAKDPDERFTSAKALGNALEIAARRADLVGTAEEVGAHVRALFAPTFEERRRFIQDRVASDPSPASVRSPEVAPPARKAPHHLAATVNDPGSGDSAPHPAAFPAPLSTPGPSESTLDGGGVSRTSTELAIASARPPRRTLWILAAVGLLTGGLAAVGVLQLDGPPPDDTAAGDTLQASTPTPSGSAGNDSQAGSNSPVSGRDSTANTAPPIAPSSATPTTATADAPATTSAAPGASASATKGPPRQATSSPSAPPGAPSTKPPTTGSVFVPPETIPANPYGAKP
ncbi:MAG: serine/threonine-protein kinase [Polyangiaceae bacterium]